MLPIYEKLGQKVELWRAEGTAMLKDHGNFKVSDVTIAQMYGGMRGVISLLCDTSEVPNDKGLIIRGRPLRELTQKSPEEIFYLLLTGDLPTDEELVEFSSHIKENKEVPGYVWDVLRALPPDTHPMVMLNTAILVMQRESVFAKHYDEGMKKNDYWKYTLEDSFNLIGRLPGIAAGIYRMRFNKGELIAPVADMDFTGDYVHMLGMEDAPNGFYELMKLFLVLHSDHEAGNVSAMTTIVVNSALSDLYYSVSAGLNGLAGPLHGLANQECIKWIADTVERFNGTPTKEQITEYVTETLKTGKVIPGYGHAVLRIVDPRFDAFLEFGKKYCSENPIFQTVVQTFEVVPEILKHIEKIKDPWPNVDAGSGALLYHYGIKELSYYTVIFALSRVLGLSAQAVVNRAKLKPITRPKSVPYSWLVEKVKSTT
jgi:citrate synthase